MQRTGHAERVQAALPAALRFVFAGGLAALVNFGSRIVLSRFVAFTAAVILAYLCGMATAFLLNRRYVFQPKVTRLREQMFWFVAVNLLGLVQTVAITLLLAHVLLPGAGITWHVEEIAHGIGIAVPMFTSYIGHKHLTFR